MTTTVIQENGVKSNAVVKMNQYHTQQCVDELEQATERLAIAKKKYDESLEKLSDSEYVNRHPNMGFLLIKRMKYIHAQRRYAPGPRWHCIHPSTSFPIAIGQKVLGSRRGCELNPVIFRLKYEHVLMNEFMCS